MTWNIKLILCITSSLWQLFHFVIKCWSHLLNVLWTTIPLASPKVWQDRFHRLSKVYVTAKPIRVIVKKKKFFCPCCIQVNESKSEYRHHVNEHSFKVTATLLRGYCKVSIFQASFVICFFCDGFHAYLFYWFYKSERNTDLSLWSISLHLCGKRRIKLWRAHWRYLIHLTLIYTWILKSLSATITKTKSIVY